MRMDRMLETLLSLGMVVGAGYVVVKYVLPSLGSPGGGGSDEKANVVGGACSGGSCDADKYLELLDNETTEGTKRLVQEAEKDGLSQAGIGGLLANANKVVTATTLALQRQLGSMFITNPTAAGGRVDTRLASAR